MALFPVSPNPRWRPAAILENFKSPYLWNGSSDRLRIFDPRLGFSGIADRMDLLLRERRGDEGKEEQGREGMRRVGEGVGEGRGRKEPYAPLSQIPGYATALSQAAR